jgi:hypothetical protein
MEISALFALNGSNTIRNRGTRQQLAAIGGSNHQIDS